jgi:hypothetical protein
MLSKPGSKGDEWRAEFTRVAREAKEPSEAALRPLDTKQLLRLLADTEVAVRDAVFGVLARRGDAKTRRALEDAIFRAPSEASDAQLFALLRMGSVYALDVCRASAASDRARRGHLLGIALAGGPTDWHVLAQQLARFPLRGPAAEAIGVHGEPRAIPVLVDMMEQGAAVAEIAWALRTITGAQHPAHAAEWRAWWNSNEWKLPPGVRHRDGAPFSLLHCIEEISKIDQSSVSREQALLELEIRSGRRFAVDSAAPGEHQTDAVAQWRQWWSRSRARFPPGTWTFPSGNAQGPTHHE